MGIFGKKAPEKEEETPQEARKKEVSDIMLKYKQKLDKEFKVSLSEGSDIKQVTTKEYLEFKEEYMPGHMSFYEKACNFSEKVLKVQPDKDKIPEYEEAIKICHLNVTPAGVASFALLGPIIVVLLGSLISFMLFNSMFFIIFFLICGAIMVMPLQKAPMMLANTWRMKASNQMVLCIFYLVTYMRHTSNLELAVEFAADHLSPPLSLDLKKVLWDVETEKYESIKQAMDAYLDTWKKWNMEFVEAFHLIESSLFESSEERRMGLLEKSLSVILDETYEKMLHYAQNLKSPITMLHMLGVILPILGLVILPLVVSFMCEVKWFHLLALYNLALPIGVYYLGKNILSTRPSGYGSTDISEGNPEFDDLKKFKIKLGKKQIALSPLMIAIFIGVVLVIIGLSPIMMKFIVTPGWDIILNKSPKQGESLIMTTTEMDDPRGLFSLLGYKESKGCGDNMEGKGDIIGPFGFGAGLISLLFVMGIGIAVGVYYRLNSTDVMKVRDRSKQLEREFGAALFQLGNRLGDGLPAEIAFSKVADVMEATTTGDFFRMVSSNITRMGMGVEQAIFDPRYGALIHFPSNIIESSMKVLTVSARKGPQIAAEALVSVSRYIKEMHVVEERLKDLMSETISSMKSQIKFMTPAIAGIVIGITSMITTILGKLTQQLKAVTSGTDGIEGAGGGFDLISMFGDGIPSFHFQIIVGFYVVQIVYILTILANGIEDGADKLKERYELGKNMINSTTSYCTVALIVMMLFNIVAGTILGSIQAGG
ncbi:hypothetical protein COV19_03635 [Candidatus Woesearchaeota archaeon CG10_big_fil_rev_8_21_14_0_10_44_13]|nr:MAG: hypothetical protein COV19_03635 [Candidatus Woesearchaeota archaeon CG10_big_fil_rev_8_21_14_0_10_44_13]